MKIVERQIASFLQRPPAEIRGVLFYGPDSGLVIERAKALIRSVLGATPNPFALTEYGFDAIKSVPHLFGDALAALPLGGGTQLLRIQQVPPAANAGFLRELEAIPAHSVVVVEGGELPPSAALRKCFETKPHLAAIACYHDEPTTIRELLLGQLALHKRSMDPGAMQLFCEMVYGDRLAIRQEIEKLLLYIGDASRIVEADVVASIAPAAEFSLERLAYFYFAGELQKAIAIWRGLEAESVSPITVIRTFLRALRRLEWVHLKMAEGQSQDTVIGALKPPLFFKYQTLFKRALSQWPMGRIVEAMGRLYACEIACKLRSGGSASGSRVVTDWMVSEQRPV